MGPDHVIKMTSKDSKPYFQFNGTNFNDWKFRMTALLDDHNFSEYITEDLEVITLHSSDREYRKHMKMEKKCKSLLIKHIADDQLEHIKDKTTAKEIYDTLEFVFERKSIAGQLMLRKKLVTLKYDGKTNIKSHLLEFDKIVRDLKSIGAKPEELDIICQLLFTMPKSYDSLVTALETINPETLNIEFVKSRLIDEYNKRNNENKQENQNMSEVYAMTSKVEKCCHFCKGKGHFKRNCGKYVEWLEERVGKPSENIVEKSNATIADVGYYL